MAVVAVAAAVGEEEGAEEAREWLACQEQRRPLLGEGAAAVEEGVEEGEQTPALVQLALLR